MTFNYLGREKPNKFLALSLSIIIAIKENKDVGRDRQRGPDSLGGSPNVWMKPRKR